jgi:hypothetical protein
MATNRKGGRGRHGPTYSNLLKGLCECALCHEAVHHLDRPGVYSYLHCNAATVHACSNQPFPYHRLEPLLYRLHEIYHALVNILPQPASRHLEQIAFLENQIQRWRAGRQRLYERMIDGAVDRDLDEVLARLADQITNAERELAKLQREQATLSIPPADRVQRFTKIRLEIESDDPATRLRARSQVAAEYRRIIDRALLNPDRTVTVRFKRRPDGIQISYVVSPERVETWWAERDGRRLTRRDLFFDSSVPMNEIAEMAERHIRAMSHDIYERAPAVISSH